MGHFEALQLWLAVGGVARTTLRPSYDCSAPYSCRSDRRLSPRLMTAWYQSALNTTAAGDRLQSLRTGHSPVRAGGQQRVEYSHPQHTYRAQPFQRAVAPLPLHPPPQRRPANPQNSTDLPLAAVDELQQRAGGCGPVQHGLRAACRPPRPWRKIGIRSARQGKSNHLFKNHSTSRLSHKR